MKLTIVEKTDQGRKALRQHLDEMKKIPFKQRMLMKALGIKQDLINKDPIKIELKIGIRHSADSRYQGMVLDEIKNSLKKNGAEKDLDYFIEDEGGKLW